MRRNCSSNRKDSPEDPQTYPFQQTVADLFHMAGRLYIVYADRFSGWPEIASTKPDATAATINSILRQYFTNFGVPEEVSTDIGPPFGSHEFETFLKYWNVSHSLFSVGYVHSNRRADAGVKTVKRLLTTNISPLGSLDTDNVAKALLLYRNTPAPDMGNFTGETSFRTQPEWSLDITNTFSKAMDWSCRYAREQFHKTIPAVLPNKTTETTFNFRRRRCCFYPGSDRKQPTLLGENQNNRWEPTPQAISCCCGR